MLSSHASIVYYRYAIGNFKKIKDVIRTAAERRRGSLFGNAN